MIAANRAERHAETNACCVEKRRRGDKSESVRQTRCASWHFGAMRMPVKQREQADDQHGRRIRQADLEGDQQTEHDDRQADAGFDEGHLDPRDAGRAADDHHREECAGNEPERATTPLHGEEADSNHDEHMIEAAERMQETMREAMRVADADMGLRDHGQHRESGAKEQSKHGTDSLLRCATVPLRLGPPQVRRVGAAEKFLHGLAMIRATSVVRRLAVRPERVVDSVTLDHEARHRRRFAFSADGGLEFLLDLERPTVLDDGDGLKLEDGTLVLVKAAPQRLLEIRADNPLRLLRIAWHIGNRHTPAEITGDAIYIEDDHTLAAMVRGQGCTVTPVERPFRPERGAYDHGHDHARFLGEGE